MDGARLANAIDFLDCHPADVTWRAGVDVLSFGATKNGALAAEAVVFFDPALVRDFELRRKRAGHLLSKSRYAAAQLLAYVQTGLWRTHAASRQSARRSRSRPRPARASRTRWKPMNCSWIWARQARRPCARRASASMTGDRPAGPEARFVVSWDQTQASVEALCQALKALPAA